MIQLVRDTDELRWKRSELMPLHLSSITVPAWDGSAGQESIKTKMFALNFYSEYYEEVLRNGRKTVTIRLGDKTDKYSAGMIVWVTIGPRFGRRQKLFTAIVDRVEVKTIDSLSPREIQKENPEFRTTEDLIHLLRRIYSDDISVEDTVTVIHFSEVSEYLH